MSIYRCDDEVTITRYFNPTPTQNDNEQVESYLQSLQKNTFHSLSYDGSPTLNKLTLSDGTIAFSIHPTTADLIKSLTDY